MATILVTDGDERSALAVVRSLGRAGHMVVVGARREKSLAGTSRFARASVVMPDPLGAPVDYAAAAGNAVAESGCEFVLPVTDGSALALLARPDAVAPARIPMPPLDAFRLASDKARVVDMATRVGIRTPRQVRAASAADVVLMAGKVDLHAPLVLKPSRSVADERAGRRKFGVLHAADWPEAARLASTLSAGAFPLLIQERVIGAGAGVFLLVWDGRLVASFAHRRLREKPPAGGVSVLCESTPLDPDLLTRSLELLGQLSWSGVAMIEYKRDAATGEVFLMEINPRFWGSLQLAVDAGVDFPRLLIECALGAEPAPVTSYRLGVRNRWWWGDADQLLTRLRRPARALHLPPDAPGRLRAVCEFLLTGLAGARGQVFQRDDPGPARLELRDRLLELLSLVRPRS